MRQLSKIVALQITKRDFDKRLALVAAATIIAARRESPDLSKMGP